MRSAVESLDSVYEYKVREIINDETPISRETGTVTRQAFSLRKRKRERDLSNSGIALLCSINKPNHVIYIMPALHLRQYTSDVSNHCFCSTRYFECATRPDEVAIS